MSFCRIYTMVAVDGREDALCAALRDLSVKLAALDGCTAVELYRGAADPGGYRFVEHWASAEAHQASAPLLGKAAFTAIMAALTERPSVEDFIRMPLTSSGGIIG